MNGRGADDFFSRRTRYRRAARRCSVLTNEPKPPLLVVEDEMFIRMIAVDTLTDRGFAVLEAADAREALDVLDTTPGIALIFTDINMPGDLDGLNLAEQVAERWPHIESIVTSGGVRLSPAEVPDSGTFLAKPYASERLAELANEQLFR